MAASIALRWAALALGLASLIVVPFLALEGRIDALAGQALTLARGPLTVSAVVATALALDVFLPVPSSLVNTAAGAMLGLWPATLVSWSGMMAGCLLGYWVGASGGTAAIRRLLGEHELNRAQQLAGRIGLGSLIVARAVPVLAEASTIAAGATGFPLPVFLTTVALSNLGIAATYAAIGAHAWAANSFLLAFCGAIGLPAIGMSGLALFRRLRPRSQPGASIVERIVAAPPIAASPETATIGATVEWQRFAVSFEYPVAFTRGLFAIDNPLLAWAVSRREPAKRHRCIVFVDGGIAIAVPDLPAAIAEYCSRHGRHIELVSAPLIIPGGEPVKSGLEAIAAPQQALQAYGMDRHSFVIAIGGGALLDAIGFVAATAHRGVRHIRIPTTVLAQNDSGVGVKNAVNLRGSKNYLGTFAPPWAVLVDFALLAHLPTRERRAGLAEAVKVALIRDRSFFSWLEDNADALAKFDKAAEETMIRRCAALHLRQITRGGDPFETGSARPLDFGHWSAHKLEALSGFELRHGEAVAIGLLLDARYSVLKGLLAPGEDTRIAALLERLGFSLWHPALEVNDSDASLAIMAGLRDFQEHLGGELTITLLTSVGTGIEVNEIDHAVMQAAIEWLRAREAMR